MAKEAIKITMNRLNKSIETKVPIFVDITNNSVKALLVTLEGEQIITIEKTYQNSYLVKVKKNISTIEVLPNFISTKKIQIPNWEKKLLPNKDGYLFLSTNKGIMSHREAGRSQLGGEILGFAY